MSMTGVMAGVAALPVGTSSACAPADGGPVADLTAEQADNARVIVAVGQQRSVPARGLLIALMTAMQESGLRNLDYGDRDSQGLFQQRPSMGWGSPSQVRDPAYAAAAFYGGPESPTENGGLLDVTGWEYLPLTRAAQAVQRSAFPDAYAKWEAPARAWLAGVLGTADDGTAGCPTVGTDPTTTPAGTAADPAPTVSGGVAVAAAKRWLGTPYSWGGGNLSGPTLGVAQGAHTVGFDCSSLVQYAWNKAGVRLPRTARPQYWAPGTRIKRMSDLRAGDLAFFAYNTSDWNSIHHVTLWLGGDAMVHAPHTGDVVKIDRRISANSYWTRQFIGGLRPAS